MAQERAPEIILRVVSLFIASLMALVAPAALAQFRGASQPHATSTASTMQAPVFLPAVTYDSGGFESLSVAVGDLNGDGKPDVVVANLCVTSGNCRNGTVGVLLGKGDGTFQPAVIYSSGGYHANSVAIADVNGDGKPDVIVANHFFSSRDHTSGGVSVLFGNGDGTFALAQSFRSGGWYASSLAVADVNGDGQADLSVGNGCTSSGHCQKGTVRVLLGKGDGTFQLGADCGTGAWIRALALADVNGDGKPDIVVAQEGGINILLGNGDGTFQLYAAYGSGGSAVRSVAVADVNSDGRPDLLVVSSCLSNSDCSSGIVGVLLGNGDGTFQPAVTYASGAVYGRSVAAGDVNGDGKTDVVVANQFGPTEDTRALAIGVLPGNGDGTLQSALTFESGGHWPTSVAVGDLNGDGKLDVVAANDYGPNGGAVGVLLNDTPFCTTPPVITGSATPRALWPPNGNMVPVTVFGTISNTGCTVTDAAWAVTDEYGKVQPNGAITLGPEGTYSFTVLLKASRLASDIDGRVYTVTVSASNNASQTGSEATTIIVPHDQRH